jgi:transaldolase
MSTGCTAQEAYWELAATDAQAACAILRPVYEMSHGTDGFVSLQVAPAHPRRARATMATICQIYRRIDRANLLVAIPATPSGVQALQATVSAGCNINATSIFSLARYASVVEAYQSGLEAFVAHGGDPTTVYGLATFSLSPVDAEADRRIEQLGDQGALELRGLAAVAQAVLAYRLFEEQFSTERWARLARRGATPQRLAWANTGTDLETDRTRQYLDALSVPHTVQLLSASTVATLNRIGLGVPAPVFEAREAAGVVSALAALHIDLDEVAAVLEKRTSVLAQDSLTDALDRLSTESGQR